MKQALTKKDWPKIAGLYNDGKTVLEIAFIYGYKSPNPISRVLKNANVPIRKFGEIRPKGKLAINTDYFTLIDSHEKAYWLGFICADGHIGSSRKGRNPDRVSFCQKRSDRVLLERFKLAISSEHKISDTIMYDKRTEKYYERSQLSVCCKSFADKLIAIGVTSTKSTNCQFPAISEKYYSSFIRGLIDGDGFVSGYENSMAIIATTSILNKISNIFEEKFNWHPTKLQPITHKHKKMMMMCVYASFREILEWIYSTSTEDTRLDRKYQNYLSCLSRPVRRPGTPKGSKKNKIDWPSLEYLLKRMESTTYTLLGKEIGATGTAIKLHILSEIKKQQKNIVLPLHYSSPNRKFCF